MKASSLLPTIAVALLCSLAVYFLMPPPAVEADAEAEAMAAKVAELEQEIERLQAERDAASDRGRPEPASYEPPVRAEDVSDLVAREVQRYFAENPGIPAGEAGEALAEGEMTEEAKQEMLQESITKVLDPGTDWDASIAIWKELAEAGLLEEGIAMLEARAEQNPGDTDLLTDLGTAYLAPVMIGEAVGHEAGVWSTKADQAWDKVLEIDDHHWEARFSKAVSLSFWPPVFGKQPEAIRNFETLIAQQNEGPAQPHHVETYVLLGNLYQQSGEAAKAEALWNQGLNLFPESTALRSSLGLE